MLNSEEIFRGFENFDGSIFLILCYEYEHIASHLVYCFKRINKTHKNSSWQGYSMRHPVGAHSSASQPIPEGNTE
jgi:hypothetical protein